jgi:hypothetical protein
MAPSESAISAGRLAPVAAFAATLPGALLLVALAWAALCWPWLFADYFISWDAKVHFYPMFRFLAGAFAAGETPFWNPYHFAGNPTIADPQSLLFSPFIVLAAVLGGAEPSMRFFDVAVLLHLLMGGAALVLYFRQRGWAPAAGLFAAVLYMMGGAAAGRLQHVGMILSYSWCAVALVALHHALARRSLAGAVGFGAAAAAMAANRDQVAYLFCWMFVAYAAAFVLARSDRWAFLRSRLTVLLVAGLVGGALLAVPLAFTLQFAALSNRPAIPLADALRGSLDPLNALIAFVPDIFNSIGTMVDHWGPGSWIWGDYDMTDRSQTYTYFGAAALVLALAHGLAGGRFLRREIRFFVVAGAVFLLYALGHFTPFFELAFRYVPGVDLYRRPADALFPLGFAFAIAAGHLAHVAAAEGAPRRAWIGALVVAAAIVAAGVVALHLAGAMKQPTAPLWRKFALAAALFAAIGAVLFWLAASARRRALVPLAAAIMATADIAWHSPGTPLNALPPSYARPYGARDGDAIARFLVPRQREAAARGERFRIEAMTFIGHWQNAPMVFRLEATNGNNPLRIAEYQMFTGVDEVAPANRRWFTPVMPSFDSPFARVLGLKYVVTSAPIETIDPLSRPERVRLVLREAEHYIYELPAPYPRVSVATRTRAVDRRAVFYGGLPGDLDFADTVLLDGPPGAGLGRTEGEAGTTRAALVHYGTTRIVIEAETDRPGHVVLNDPYYPGWRAYVNGERRPLVRGNLLFRAVAVPAGRHRVEFRFEPFSADGIGALFRRAAP